jgi:hypothetical protein
MWNYLQSFIQVVIPNRIEDSSQKTTDIKLATGIVFGFTLVAIAFAILTGFGQIVIEEFGNLKFSNASIFVLLGVFFIWLTITKVGINNDQQKK